MKKIIDFCVRYKVWLLIVALFSSNGFQAYLNSIGIEIPETKVEAKPTITKNITKVINCNSGRDVEEHVKEHHGGK